MLVEARNLIAEVLNLRPALALLLITIHIK